MGSCNDNDSSMIDVSVGDGELVLFGDIRLRRRLYGSLSPCETACFWKLITARQL